MASFSGGSWDLRTPKGGFLVFFRDVPWKIGMKKIPYVSVIAFNRGMVNCWKYYTCLCQSMLRHVDVMDQKRSSFVQWNSAAQYKISYMKISPSKGSSTEMKCQHEASAVERKIYCSSEEKMKRNSACFNMHTLLGLLPLTQASSPWKNKKSQSFKNQTAPCVWVQVTGLVFLMFTSCTYTNWNASYIEWVFKNALASIYPSKCHGKRTFNYSLLQGGKKKSRLN